MTAEQTKWSISFVHFYTLNLIWSMEFYNILIEFGLNFNKTLVFCPDAWHLIVCCILKWIRIKNSINCTWIVVIKQLFNFLPFLINAARSYIIKTHRSHNVRNDVLVMYKTRSTDCNVNALGMVCNYLSVNTYTFDFVTVGLHQNHSTRNIFKI